MIRALVLALALVVLVGCSSIQLGYRNADTILRWQADSYLDLEGPLSEELDSRIAAFLGWHRAGALPQYAKLLDEAAARASRGFVRADVLWAYDSARVQLQEALRTAAAGAGPLLDRLPAENIAHLERRLAENNRKYAKEMLAGTPEDRRKRRLRRNIERLEDWLGSLSEAQQERVRQYTDAAPLAAEMRDRDRRRRQSEMLAMLRARQASLQLVDWMGRWESDRAPAFAAAALAQRTAFIDMLVDLDRSLSPAQRQHLSERLRGYADDARALARPAQGNTAK